MTSDDALVCQRGLAVVLRLRGLDEVVSVKIRRDFLDGVRQLHRKSRPCRMVEVRRFKDVSDVGAEELHKVAGGGLAFCDPRPALLWLKVEPDQALLDLLQELGGGIRLGTADKVKVAVSDLV